MAAVRQGTGYRATLGNVRRAHALLVRSLGSASISRPKTGVWRLEGCAVHVVLVSVQECANIRVMMEFVNAPSTEPRVSTNVADYFAMKSIFAQYAETRAARMECAGLIVHYCVKSDMGEFVCRRCAHRTGWLK